MRRSAGVSSAISRCATSAGISSSSAVRSSGSSSLISAATPLGAEAGDQALLLLGVEVAEDVGREVARQQAEHQRRLILLEALDQLGDVGRLELEQRLAQLVVAALRQQLPDIRAQKAVQRIHGRLPLQAQAPAGGASELRLGSGAPAGARVAATTRSVVHRLSCIAQIACVTKSPVPSRPTTIGTPQRTDADRAWRPRRESCSIAPHGATTDQARRPRSGHRRGRRELRAARKRSTASRARRCPTSARSSTPSTT